MTKRFDSPPIPPALHREKAAGTSNLMPRCYFGGREVSVAQMGSSFGQLFRIMTWGESHGGGVGVVIDGCPPRLSLSEQHIQPDPARPPLGHIAIVRPRTEE